MKKALAVVQKDEDLSHIERVLFALGHSYDHARYPEEADWLMGMRSYDYIMADLLMWARWFDGDPYSPAHGNLLGQARHVQVNRNVPLILLIESGTESVPFIAEMFVIFASILRQARAVAFVKGPLPQSGRRLYDAIKHVLALGALEAHPAFRQLLEEEPELIESLLPATLSSPMLRSSISRTNVVGAAPVRPAKTMDSQQSITVTEAATMLLDVVSGINLGKAKARISKAAVHGKFKTNGKKGHSRRIELDSFNTWRFRQREQDLNANDE